MDVDDHLRGREVVLHDEVGGRRVGQRDGGRVRDRRAGRVVEDRRQRTRAPGVRPHLEVPVGRRRDHRHGDLRRRDPVGDAPTCRTTLRREPRTGDPVRPRGAAGQWAGDGPHGVQRAAGRAERHVVRAGRRAEVAEDVDDDLRRAAEVLDVQVLGPGRGAERHLGRVRDRPSGGVVQERRIRHDRRVHLGERPHVPVGSGARGREGRLHCVDTVRDPAPCGRATLRGQVPRTRDLVGAQYVRAERPAVDPGVDGPARCGERDVPQPARHERGRRTDRSGDVGTDGAGETCDGPHEREPDDDRPPTAHPPAPLERDH